MLKKLLLIVILHFAIGQELDNQIYEEELTSDDLYLNMSWRGLEETLDLASLSKLEVVDFSNNAIAHLDWRLIETAPNLKTLDLSRNPNLALPATGPSVEIPLKVLNMSYCLVQVLESNSLKGLSNLEVLDLRGNPIVFEKSQAFEKLETPPKVLIISSITKQDLSYVCKNVDMKVEVVDDDMEYDCKNVRRNEPGPTKISRDREQIPKEVMVDELLLTDTHLPMNEMLADEPIGSGDDATAENDANVNETSVENTNEVASEEVKSAETEDEPVETAETEDKPVETKDNSTETEDKPVETEDNSAKTEDKPVDTKDNSTEIENKPEETAETENKTAETSEEPTIDVKPLDANSNSTNEEKHEEEPTPVPTVDNTRKSEIDAQMVVPNLIHKSEETFEDHEHLHHDKHDSERVDDKMDSIVEKQPMQKSILTPVDTAPIPVDNTDAVLGANKTPESSASTGKSVILILVIGAAIMGSAFGLMKVYKDRKRNATTNDPMEKEMKELPERKPLIYENRPANANNGQAKQIESDTVDQAQPAEMSTKDILNNPDALPDIDDPSRLSTIIVSNSNLDTAM